MKVSLLISIAICSASSAAQQNLPVLHPTFTTIGTLHDTTVNWQAAGSPNGRFVAYTSTAGDFRLFDANSGRSTVIGGAMKWESWPSWSPKGDMVFFTYVNDSHDASVYAIDLDPSTGIPRDTPRRVTIEGGINASASPDGKWVAYNRTDNDANPITDLLVVPSQGGASRKLVTAHLAMPTRWSPDGKWIYYVAAGPTSAFPDGSAAFDIYRVPSGGGTPQRVVRTAGTWPGLSPDGRYIVARDGSVSDTLRHAVVFSSSGKRLATFTTPLGPETGHWVDNYRFLITRDDQKRQLRTVDMTGMALRTLTSAGPSVLTASYSPDGKHIAALQRNGSRTSLLVMSRDGKVQRTIALRNVVAGAQLKWSPNSRYLTYVGARDANRAVNIIDITSGVEKPLVSGTQTISRDLAWRTDGRSILYSRITSFGASPALNDLEIREVTVDGKDKLIRSIPHEALSNGNGPTGIRLSDSVAVSIGSSGVWAVPYSGGPARQLLKGQTTRTVFTPDGRALVHGIETTPDQGIKALQLLGLDGQVIRTVRLPFTGFVTAFDRIIPLTPDGRAAVIVGRDAGSSSAKIYRVPLDGAAPTPIADLTDKAASQIDVSPDGRSILYTAIGPEASSFVLVDLTDALKRLSRSH